LKAQTQEFDAKVEKQAEEIESLRKMAADTTQSLLRQMIAFWNSFVWVGKLIMAGMYGLLWLECDYNVIMQWLFIFCDCFIIGLAHNMGYNCIVGL